MSFTPPGGRSSQAIVDGAMNALRALVKERLSGRSGGSGYSQQVDPALSPCSSFYCIYLFIYLSTRRANSFLNILKQQ